MDAGDRVRLRHMLDAAREALGFAEHRTLADLVSDRMLVLAACVKSLKTGLLDRIALSNRRT